MVLRSQPGAADKDNKDPAKLHTQGAGSGRAQPRSPTHPLTPLSPRSAGHQPPQNSLLSRQEKDTARRKRAVTGSQLALLAERLESRRSSSSTDLDINQKLCIHVTPTPSPPAFR